MDVLITVIEGVPGGLLATAITIFVVRLLPPRIKISPQVATIWSPELGELRNRFKVINKSRRPIVDLKFELMIVYYKDRRVRTVIVPSERPEPLSIPGRKMKTGRGVYSFTRGETLIDDLLDRAAVSDGYCALRLRVFGRDSWSGLGRQFEMDYRRPFEGTLEYGTFGRHVSLEVQPAEPAHERWSKKLDRAREIASRTSSLTPADLPDEEDEPDFS